jgi:hypothetical protein
MSQGQTGSSGNGFGSFVLGPNYEENERRVIGRTNDPTLNYPQIVELVET